MSTEANKVKIKIKSRKEKGVERYSSLFFKLSGVFLLFYALYFYYTTEKDFFDTLFHSFFLEGKIKQVHVGVTSTSSYVALLYRFLPAVFLSLGCSFLFKRYPYLSYYLNSVAILGLTFFHGQLFFHKYFYNDPCHTNYFITTLFLLVPTAVFLLNYTVNRKPFTLFLTSVYFYVFIFELLVLKFEYLYVFSVVLLYSVFHFLLSRKDYRFGSNVLNSLFAYSFLAVFVLRKLYVGHYDSFLSLYFVFSFLYFVLFLFIGLYYYLKTSSASVYTYLFVWFTTAFYLIATGLVLHVFYHSLYFLPLLVALFVHGALLYYVYVLQKNTVSLLAFELATLLLASLFITSLWITYAFELFFGSLCVLLLYYNAYVPRRITVWISLAFLQVLLVYFTYLFLAFYVPVFAGLLAPVPMVLEKGFVTSAVLLAVVYGVYYFLKKSKDSLHTTWFDKRTYVHFLQLFLVLTVFVFVEWVGFLSLYALSGSTVFFSTVFYVIGALYLLYLLFNRLYLPQPYKTVLFYLFYLLAFLVPFVGYFKFPYRNLDSLAVPNYLFVASILHYLEFVLVLLLLLKAYFIVSKKVKSSFSKRFFEFTLSLIAIVLLCKEYDFIYLLTHATTPLQVDHYDLALSLAKNKLLPYSLLMLLLSILLLLVGIYANNKYIRLFSVIVIGCTLFKVFYLEYNLLSTNERFGMMVILGLAFLLISWIYTQQKSRRIASRSR